MNEKGNVLFLILIAVALFAALSYVFSSSMRGGVNSGNEESLIESSGLIQFGASVSQAVSRMTILNQAEEHELCFYTGANDETYDHAGCADDKHKIFHPQGGGVGYQKPSEKLNGGLEWEFTANARVMGIKNDNPNDPESAEIVMLLRNFDKILCQRINDKIGISEIPVDFGDIDIFRFDGDFVGTDVIDGCNPDCLDIEDSPFASRSVNYGCFQEEATGDHIYFHLLHAR